MPWEDLKGQIYLGGDEFVERVTSRWRPMMVRFRGSNAEDRPFPWLISKTRRRRETRPSARLTHFAPFPRPKSAPISKSTTASSVGSCGMNRGEPSPVPPLPLRPKRQNPVTVAPVLLEKAGPRISECRGEFHHGWPSRTARPPKKRSGQ
jgi:hypothetical protein